MSLEERRTIDNVTRKLTGDLTGMRFRYHRTVYTVVRPSPTLKGWWIVQDDKGYCTTFSADDILCRRV